MHLTYRNGDNCWHVFQCVREKEILSYFVLKLRIILLPSRGVFSECLLLSVWRVVSSIGIT